MPDTTKVKPGLWTRIKAAGDALWTPSGVGFGPGEPIRPQAPLEPLRQMDYNIARNIQFVPRAAEARAVTYDQMRNLSRTYGILRTVIEKRKDEIKGLQWTIAPKPEFANEDMTPQINGLLKFFEKPDGEHTFDQWIGMMLEDLLVIDAATIYRRKDRGGRLLALDIVDGATVLVLVNDKGRIPAPPEPAYEQVIKGFPRTWWTKDEMLYQPYNLASDGVYGWSHVESIIFTINIALRRDTSFLEYFRSGNIPQGLIQAPETWTPSQVIEAQEAFDTLLAGDLAQRSKIHLVPGGGSPVQMLQQLSFDALFDEWLARICCARFGVSPAPYVRMMERATAETVEEAATEESLVPMMDHLKSMMDLFIEEDHQQPKLEWVWTTGQLHYRSEDSRINSQMLHDGCMTINDVRKQKGLPKIEGGDTPMIWGSAPAKLEDVMSGNVPQQGFNGGTAFPPYTDPFALSIGEDEPTLQEKVRQSAGEPDPFELSIRAIKEELNDWEKFAVNRLGKKSTREFEFACIPLAQATRVKNALLEVKDVKSIKAVFDTERQNIGRTRVPSVRGDLDKLMKEYREELTKTIKNSKANATTSQKDIGIVAELLPEWSNDVIRTWAVDGDQVRAQLDKTFVEGGHDLVYGEGSDRIAQLGIPAFIPPGNIWLEKSMKKTWPLIMLHEIYERNLMKGGIKYDPAHEEADRIEEDAEAKNDPVLVERLIQEQLLKAV